MHSIFVTTDPSPWVTVECTVTAGDYQGVPVWRVDADEALIRARWRGHGTALFDGPTDFAPDIAKVTISRSSLEALKATAEIGTQADLKAAALSVCAEAGITVKVADPKLVDLEGL